MLILAFLLLCLLSNALRRWLPVGCSPKVFERVRFSLILVACILAHLFSQVWDLNIPRCNNTFTALWLILCGYVVYNRLHMQFDNGWMALGCAAGVYGLTVLFGPNILITNDYHNVISLTLCSFSALYSICFVARKIENTWVGKGVAWLGRHSFAIMALHLLAFQVAALALRLTVDSSQPQGLLNPVTNQSLLLLAYYTLAGVLLPAFAATALAWLRRQIEAFRGRHGCHRTLSDDTPYD